MDIGRIFEVFTVAPNKYLNRAVSMLCPIEETDDSDVVNMWNHDDMN